MLARWLVLAFVTVCFAITAVGAGNAAAQERLNADVVPQIGHADTVMSVALSSDGRVALSGGRDNTVRLWDATTGRELRTFTGHTAPVYSVALSSDGRTALSGSEDQTLRLWDTATGKELRTFRGHTTKVWAVVLSADGRTALSGSWDHTLKLWDLSTGKELRTLTGHTREVIAVALSADGRTALSGSDDQTMKLWDTATGKELRTFAGHTASVSAVALSLDGRTALSGSTTTLKLWDTATGHELRTLEGKTGFWHVALSTDWRTAIADGDNYTLTRWDIETGKKLAGFSECTERVTSIALSADGRVVLSSCYKTLKLWDTATGKELRSFTGYADWVQSVALFPDGRTVLSASRDQTVKVWDITTGKELRSFTGHTSPVAAVAVSADGRIALSGDWEGAQRLWDTATGTELRAVVLAHGGDSVALSANGRRALSLGGLTLELWDTTTGKILERIIGPNHAAVLSPNGRVALSDYDNDMVKLWDIAKGRELMSFTGHTGWVVALALSADGRTALSGSDDKTLKLWDTATGKELHTLTGHTGSVLSVALSADSRLALSGSEDHTLKLWDTGTGSELRTFIGHTGEVASVALTGDGRTVVSGGRDGTTRIWDTGSGRERVRMIAASNGEWLTMTPEGFFHASQRDTELLAIVRGLDATTIGQVHQSLFNPDLVREALAGDPDGEVKRAAEVINLDRVLDAGPPPVAVLTSHATSGKSATDLITLAARITDRGRGIGRIEWRVNGVTAGVTAKPADTGPDYDAQQTLALDPGGNQIEVIAYEGRNIIASLPARTTITYTGPAGSAKPKLHILAIGIDKYVDPGAGKFGRFLPLGLAVADAKAFGAEMKKAGVGMYSDVVVTEVLDADATPDKLDRLIERIGATISPRDTFVFYAAAHGISHNGRFYMIPQDYQGGADPDALAKRAIDQDRLQGWIANRIKAKKAVILLDTCESGAAINGYTVSRTDGPATEAAVGRLHEATGRPVLTAAAAGEYAREGYKGHGVFTYALMEALHKGDANNNGKIELTELVAHVEKRVPELVGELDKHGGAVKGLAVVATAARGTGSDRQTAHFGSTGEDFAIAARLP